MAEGKEIKIKFVIDEQSAQRANRVLDDMIKRAQDLAKTLQGVGGGGGGGFMGFGSVGGRSPSAQTTFTKAAGQSGGQNVKMGFVGAIGQNVGMLKKMGEEGTQAMKAMSDALQTGIAKQKSSIGALEGELAKLLKMYQGVGVQGGEAFAGKIQERIAGVVAKLGEARKEFDELRKTQDTLGKAMGPEEAPAKEGIWSKLTKSRSMPGAGAMEGMMSKSSMGQLLGGLGITPGMMGGAALGMIGAWGIKNIAKQVEGRPDQFLASESKQATMLAQKSLDLRSGEFRNRAAEHQILLDSEKRKDYEDLNSGWRRFKSSAGAFFSGDFADAFTGRAADQATAERRRAQVEMQRQTDPLMDLITGEAQNYRGTMSTMRSMGLGARKGEWGYQALARQRAAYSQFDDSEIAAAFQGVSGAGTRRAAYGLQGGVMHATAAGIHGAAQSVGTLSKFGGKSAGVFSDEMRRMASGGNIDASTVGLLSSYLAQQQDRLGVTTGAGPGSFQGAGLMEALSRGTQGEGGRLVAEQNIKGADYLQRAMTGGTSPYQAARNFMIAGEAAPGLNMYGQGFLAQKMSISEIMDAAEGKGGGVSGVFQALGGNKEQAGKYFKGVTGSLLEGITSQGLGDTDTGRLVQAISESGMDPREFFKKGKYKNVKGQKGKAMTQEQAISAYAGGLLSADMDMDAATAEGTARMIAGVGPGAAKGKGRAGVSGELPEAKMAAEHLKLLSEQAQKATSALNDMSNSMKSTFSMGAWEAQHRAANTTITPDQRMKAEAWLAQGHGGASPQEIDNYLAELDKKAAEAERAKAAEAEKRRQEQIQRRWDKY